MSGASMIGTFANAAEEVDLAYEVRSTMGELRGEKLPSLLTMGIKSENGLGGISEMGNYLRSKDEIFFGFRTPAGWGLLISDGYTYKNHHSHNQDDSSTPGLHQVSPHRSSVKSPQAGKLTTSSTDQNQNIDEQVSLTDPSGIQDLGLQFFHPIAQDDRNNISGMFRASFPTTVRSESTHTYNFGYNFIYSLRLPRQWNFSTVGSIAYSSRDAYTAPLDTNYGEGVIYSFNRRVLPWVKLGAGQRLGVAQHTERPAGTSLEAFTTADFLVTPRIFMGPRIHFPLYTAGPTRSDIPVNPALRNISADFFMQIAL